MPFTFLSLHLRFLLSLNMETLRKFDRNLLTASVFVREKVDVYPEFVPRSARFLKLWTRLYKERQTKNRQGSLRGRRVKNQYGAKIKSEERDGGRHAMVKVPPARKAPQNGFFPFSERTENSHWLRGSRGNKWSCWLARKLSSKKLSIKRNTRSFQNM